MSSSNPELLQRSNRCIGFIGLGVMGYPMAMNLRRGLSSDVKFVICDLNEEAVQKFQLSVDDKSSVVVASNVAEMIGLADILVTVLPFDEALEKVYLDLETGALAGLQSLKPPGSAKLLIECGTMSLAAINRVSDALTGLDGVTFVDAPISGGPMGSQAGTLSIMVGCSTDLFPQLKSDLLVHMGDPDNIIHCGDVGTGTAFKIINNYISIISILSVSEAYNIAERMNLNIPALTALLQSGSAQCWMVSKNNPVPGVHPNAPASNGYKGGYRIEMAHKVLSLGRDLAQTVGASTVLDKAAIDVLAKVAADPRYSGKDARVVYKYLSEN